MENYRLYSTGNKRKREIIFLFVENFIAFVEKENSLKGKQKIERFKESYIIAQYFLHIELINFNKSRAMSYLRIFKLFA